MKGKQNQVDYLTTVSGFSESKFNVYVADESALLTEKYLITFDDTSSIDNVFLYC